MYPPPVHQTRGFRGEVDPASRCKALSRSSRVIGERGQGDNLRSGDDVTDDAAVAVLELCKVEPEEIVMAGGLLLAEILPSHCGHLLVVFGFAMGMNRVAPLMPPEISIELRADVIELMEQRDQLFFERLIEKSGEAKSDEVEHLDIIDDKALDLVGDPFSFSKEIAFLKSQGSDASLKPVGVAIASLDHGE